jgi:hypothetical protein
MIVHLARKTDQHTQHKSTVSFQEARKFERTIGNYEGQLGAIMPKVDMTN